MIPSKSSRLLALLALLALFAVGSPLPASADAVAGKPVAIDAGSVVGEVLDREANLQVFRGIPFAAPPVGERRWAPPAAVEPWDGVRECKQFSAVCPQEGTLAAMMGETLPELSEDCLYLNVWSTAVGTDSKLPVMVWIHGGGLTLGWGHQKSYEGSQLAKKGVVLVSINYRLGPFGFISHPELSAESPEGASGNYGFLDQIAALQWVQDNIASFGGDPERVTIFGESAGGTSVHMLTASPMSKGLIHGAISQSSWVTDTNMTYLTKPVPHLSSAEQLGLDWASQVTKQEQPSLNTLRSLTTEQIMQGSTGFQPVCVADGYFLPDLSENIFAAGKQNDIPMIVGTNRNEGTMFLQMTPYRTVDAFREALRETYGDRAKEVLSLYPVTDDQQLPAVLDQFITDTWFVRNSRSMLLGMQKVSSPAYEYFFTRASTATPMMGAHHAAEIPYAFNTLAGTPEQTDQKLADAMIQYWVSFATDGNPNVEGLPQWPEFDVEGQRYLELGDTIQVGQELRRAACETLDQVRGAEFSAQTAS